MKLLLDTHIWIWSYLEPQRLATDVARELIDPAHERFLSPVSIWEMLFLLEKNRVRISEGFSEWFKKSIVDLEIQEVPLSWEVAQEMQAVTLLHKDPADRLLVATAKTYEMTLVTADQQLMNVPGIDVLPNR
jgi:PIN domain nuclease of toxin-antitoxin system